MKFSRRKLVVSSFVTTFLESSPVFAAGSTTTQPASAPFKGDAVSKGASIPSIIFNDSKGPRPFINGVQVSLFNDQGTVKINYSFNTDGELGGGIHPSRFSFQILNKGNVIFTSRGLPFEGECRGGDYHHKSGSDETSVAVFNAADNLYIPPFTVDIYPC